MTEPIWLDQPLVIALHDRQLAEHGGAEGVRDMGLLESALGKPINLYHYAEPNIFELAAAYTSGIVQNHPFVDGNKRTGFVAGVLFLELNGARFEAPEETAAKAVIDLAAGAMDEVGYATWLKENSAG